jgi:hypothetical protein
MQRAKALVCMQVAAAHAAATAARGGRGRAAASTSAAVGTEAANTIMAVEPVPMLRSYAVQIMANYLKQTDNNMRCVLLVIQDAIIDTAVPHTLHDL